MISEPALYQWSRWYRELRHSREQQVCREAGEARRQELRNRQDGEAVNDEKLQNPPFYEAWRQLQLQEADLRRGRLQDLTLFCNLD